MKCISVIALLMMSLLAACGYPLTRPTLPPTSVASTQTVNLNTEAAQLAIEASGDLEPPPTIYGRVLSDLAAIRAAYPLVSDIKARSAWDPHHLLIGFDEGGNTIVEQDTYRSWDDLNTRYGD